MKVTFFKSVLALISIFTLLIPFNRGMEINELKITGKYIVNCVNQHKIQTGAYPKDQNELVTICKNLNKIHLTDNTIKYIFVDAEIMNEKNKNDKGYTKMVNSSFRLYLEPEFMKPDRMYYNEPLNDFLLAD